MKKCIILLLMSSSLQAHRPSYSVFPQTVDAGGRSPQPELYGIHTQTQLYLFPAWDFIYGFENHENLNLEIYMPAFIRTDRCSSESPKKRLSGLGEMILYFKYRFYKKGDEIVTNQAAIELGVRLPTSTQREDTNIGSSSPGFVAYFAFAHEDIHWYFYGFTGTILSFPTTQLFDGHQFYASLAGFYRPQSPKLHVTDWAFGIEVSALWNLQDKFHNVTDPNSGFNVLFIGPSFGRVHDEGFWSGGIQWAVAQKIFGIQPKVKSRFIISYSTTY